MKAIECSHEVAKSAHEGKAGSSAVERLRHHVRTIMGQVLSNGLPPADPRVGICVGCIQTQIAGFTGPVVERMVPGGRFTGETIDFVADQVVEFSLAGMRAIARKSIGPASKTCGETSERA